MFESPSPEVPVMVILERFSFVNPTNGGNPITYLIHGDSIGIYLDGGGSGESSFARMLSSDGDISYIVFRDTNKFPGIAYTPAVEPMSSVISHDLRDPLNIVKVHLQVVREAGDTEHFEAVANAHKQMERIIRGVLTISWDRAMLDPTDNASMETATKDAWQSIGTECATLDVADTLPTATTGSGRVQRLFENPFRDVVEHGATAGQTLSDDGARSDSMSNRAANSTRAVTVTVGALESDFYAVDDGPGIPMGR